MARKPNRTILDLHHEKIEHWSKLGLSIVAITKLVNDFMPEGIHYSSAGVRRYLVRKNLFTPGMSKKRKTDSTLQPA